MVDRASRDHDIVVKASSVGVFDALLEDAVLAHRRARSRIVFWDVDAPATLERLRKDPKDPFRQLVPQYDIVLTFGGGAKVIAGYERLGARRCVPIYNALDADIHHPAAPDARFRATLALLANRHPDREGRIEEFFLHPAAQLPDASFLLGGSGWDDKECPPNVRRIGHVFTAVHNAFNSTPLAVLNVARDSMASCGYSPATRIFEAAGAAACIITDAWAGIESFLEPDQEILVAADGDGVVRHLRGLTPARARAIGEAAARRIRKHHTYAFRAREVEAVLSEKPVATIEATS
jgi:spore maturation protein CgeB